MSIGQKRLMAAARKMPNWNIRFIIWSQRSWLLTCESVRAEAH
jgi:hypothetical protein